MITKQTCENCRYYLPPDKPGHNGRCRRFPPLYADTSSGNNDEGLVEWVGSSPEQPWVSVLDWCGEWKKGEDGR